MARQTLESQAVMTCLVLGLFAPGHDHLDPIGLLLVSQILAGRFQAGDEVRGVSAQAPKFHLATACGAPQLPLRSPEWP